MKAKPMALLLVVCLVLGGCATYGDRMVEEMAAGLDPCLGKLTKERLIMQASAPSETVPVSNGEILIYKYRRSNVMTTTTGTGGLLFPYQSDSKTYEYALDVRLRFNEKGVLDDYNWRGHGYAFSHPFFDLGCK